MTLSAAGVWEVRTTGADTNAGYFKSGAAGTDYSQQNAAQFSGTLLAVDATTNTKVTSTEHSFAAADVGNGINVSAGVGWSTGVYEIVSVAGGAATLDRSPAATSTTGGTWAEGGALASPGKVLGAAVTSNRIWCKLGTYTVSANPTINPASGVPSGAAPATRITGYSTTRGDGGRPIWQAAGGCTILLPLTGSSGWWVENVSFDCAGVANSAISGGSAQYSLCRNCKFVNFKVSGWTYTNAPNALWQCEFTGGISGATAAIVCPGGTLVTQCNIHDNACAGITSSATGTVLTWNLITNNTGATSDGVACLYATTIQHNTISGNGRDGIRNTTSSPINCVYNGNILAQNGGYGLNFSGGSVGGSAPEFDGNAYYANTSGARNNCGTGTTDVILSADPFTAKGSGDWSLNTAAGGGAACRAAGLPGLITGSSTTGYPDLGAAQSKATGGSKRREW